jgi:4-amino-4-deoxy-L-arabinose transferase-like glycosyltransferase
LIEREWREASDMRVSGLALAGVLASATVLRFWALGHGIPFAPGVDEPEIVVRAVNMMKNGSFDPHHFFDYPGLYIYVQVLVSIVRFVTGAIGGEWGSLNEAPADAFFLWGRAVTALFGVATVLLVFRIGLRWGARHALLAAGLLAVLPLHVYYSHYVLTDTPLTFFVTLTLLLSLIAQEKGTVKAFAWAGAVAGLAAATKYNGGSALVMPLLACWMSTPSKSKLTCTLAIVGAAGAGFLIGAPYTILDLPAFLNSFARLAGEYRGTARLPEEPWITYLKHLRIQFGWPALLLTFAGVIMGIVRVVRGPGRVRWAVVVVFPLVYFWMVSHQQIVYARYLLPIVPMLCVLAATAVVSGVSLLRRYEIPRAPRTALIVALTVAALLPPSIESITSDRSLGQRGTAALAFDWIMQNLPHGSYVALEARNLLLPDDAFRHENMKQLRLKTYAEFVAGGVDYLVASSQCYGPYFENPQKYPAEYAEYMRIFEQSKELIRFTPIPDKVPGSELRIFKVKP